MSDRRSGGILCIGVTPCLQRTLRFSSFQVGEVNRASSAALSSGGKAVNVARTLKVLQESPLVTGFAGGESGNSVDSFLRQMGIETDFVWTSQATRVCTTLVDDASGSVTELVEEAPLPAADEWSSLDEKLDSLVAQSGMMVVAGAPPPGSPDDVYAGYAVRARESGSTLLLDARGAPLTQALRHSPLLAKLNQQELAATCGSPVDTERALRASAQRLLGLGARWVLVTRGDREAWLLDENAVWRFKPPAVAVLNAIGAGDATTAGIAAGLKRGHTMPDAVRLGIACGSASATKLTPGDVDPRSVEQLATEVRVTRTPA